MSRKFVTSKLLAMCCVQADELRAVMGFQPLYQLQSVAKTSSASWRIFVRTTRKHRACGSLLFLQYRCVKNFIILLPKKLINDILIVLQIVDITITQLSSDKESKTIKT